MFHGCLSALAQCRAAALQHPVGGSRQQGLRVLGHRSSCQNNLVSKKRVRVVIHHNATGPWLCEAIISGTPAWGPNFWGSLGQNSRERRGFRNGPKVSVGKQEQQGPNLPFRISGSSCAGKQLRQRTLPAPQPGQGDEGTHVLHAICIPCLWSPSSILSSHPSPAWQSWAGRTSL